MATDTDPLHAMTMTTPTRYWNDSCVMAELNAAIAHGADGATSDPLIVLRVLQQEDSLWRERVLHVINENPTWTESQVSWHIYRELALRGAEVLHPIFEATNGRRGHFSIQTDPALYRDRDGLLIHATAFSVLAPNMQVKVPATSAGIAMLEDATFRGVNLNVTVTSSVAQVLAAAEQIERGLRRREAEGRNNAFMVPVVTLMLGANDDWMQCQVLRNQLDISSEVLAWSGIACFKRAYALCREQGYRVTLLVDTYRTLHHWTELLGGEIVMAIPWDWQVAINAANLLPISRIDLPVDPTIITTLMAIPDFQRAYQPEGLTTAEFDHFGPTVRTLRALIAAWHTFVGMIRDMMLPNPDVQCV